MIQPETLTHSRPDRARSTPSRGTHMSLQGLLLAALICTTAGVVRVAGHTTACGNINNEKVFVNALYADVLNRDPDRKGFRLRRNKIIQCGADAACIDNARANVTLEFFSQNEFYTRTGINVADNGQFIRALYLHLLRREPTPDEHADKLGELNRTGDRVSIVRTFITSDEYRSRCFPEAHLLLRFGAGRENATDADYIAEHWRRMQQQAPFLDGITVITRGDNGIDLTDRLITDSPVDTYPLTQTTQKIRLGTDGWRQHRTFTDNFILLRSTPPAAYSNFTSWSDDRFWGQVNLNARRMARFAKESGLKGFLLDPEQYQGHFAIWSCPRMAPRDSLDPGVVCGASSSVHPYYVDKVRRRGQAFMEAILDGYPDITIMTTFGHSFVHFEGDVSLYAGFVDGMLLAIEARGARPFHDGIEVYNRPLEPEGLYREAMGDLTLETGDVAEWGAGWYYSSVRPVQQQRELGSLPYWLDPHINYGFDTSVVKEGVRRALKTSDRYTWLYSERTSFFNDPNVPQAVLDALCRAKAEAAEESLRCNPPNPLFDFDGDGKADLSVFRPTEQMWYLSRSRDGFDALQFGLATDVLTPADYDGDGKTDVAVWRPSAGMWYLQRSLLGFTAVNWGREGDKAAPGDYDGDGRADVAVYRPSDGTWYIIQSSTNNMRAVRFGASEDAVVPGDYDGDGKTDVAVWRPSTGMWYVLSSRFDTSKGTQLGAAGDKLVPADYDGDGRTDIAVYRPSNGTWYLLRSREGRVEVRHGASTDIPAPADYDGDGRVDVTVFRPDNGYWYLKRSASIDTAEHFGQSGDMPLASVYIP